MFTVQFTGPRHIDDPKKKGEYEKVLSDPLKSIINVVPGHTGVYHKEQGGDWVDEVLVCIAYSAI